jgi:hypothetical protein
LRFFEGYEILDDLSVGRVLPDRITRMFAHHHTPELPTECDWSG